MATRKSSRRRSPRASEAKAPASGASRRSRKPARKPARRPAARAARKSATADRRARSSPETLRLRSMMPALTVGDLQKSIAFYTGVLRFIVGEQWKDGEVLRGAMLTAGSCSLGLSQDDWKMGRDRKKGQGVRVWCETIQDIDALAAGVKAAGHSLTEEPHDQQWGGRAFSLDDPDGYHLTIFKG
jgi:lactoylglutathione lyase